jgi:hypothetical protein
VIRSLLLFVSALVWVACPAMASTFYVGSCHAKSFTTISQAVSTVPAGSIIDICPGSYSEQVIISKSMTLQGIASQNASDAELSCLNCSTAESQVLGLSLVPTIWVTAGTVNISNLTVVNVPFQATRNCPQFPTGVFYASGTSGTVNHADIQASGFNCGVGIAAENATADDSSIKIENSFINSDDFGILMGSQQPEGVNSVLLNTITGNMITGGLHGMFLLQSRGKVSGNNIIISTVSGDNSSYGISESAPATTITDNVIWGPSTGVIMSAAATVSGNKISTQFTGTGIDLECTAATVTNNTILATVGLNHVPASFTGKNRFIFSPNEKLGGC